MKALAALVEREEWTRALARAVELWRAHRCAALGELIDAISARAASATQPLQPTERKTADFHRAWLALCADDLHGALRVGPLLDSLTSKLPRGEGDVWSVSGTARRYAGWLERVAALASVEDDPRVAQALLSVLSKAPFSVGYDAPNAACVYGPALEIVGRVADVRAIQTLEQLSATAKTTTLRGYHESAVPAVVAAIGAAAAALDADAERRCDALLGRLAPSRPPGQSEEQLLSSLLRSPQDDGLLGVYADALNERGDPRGELIALQQAEERGETSAKQKKRIRALIKAHEGDWLGPLTAVTRSRHYRRGLLDAASLAPSSAASDETWQAAAHDERFATVRALYKGRSTEQLYQQFVLSDVMRRLGAVEATTRAMLGRFAAAPLAAKLASLGVWFAPKAGELDAFANLRELTLVVGAGSARKQVKQLASRAGTLERLALRFKGTDDDAQLRALSAGLGAWAALAPKSGPFELVVGRELVLRRPADSQGGAISVDVEIASAPLLHLLSEAELPAIARLQLSWVYAASDIERAEVPVIEDLLARIGAAELVLEPDMATLLER